MEPRIQLTVLFSQVAQNISKHTKTASAELQFFFFCRILDLLFRNYPAWIACIFWCQMPAVDRSSQAWKWSSFSKLEIELQQRHNKIQQIEPWAFACWHCSAQSAKSRRLKTWSVCEDKRKRVLWVCLKTIAKYCKPCKTPKLPPAPLWRSQHHMCIR